MAARANLCGRHSLTSPLSKRASVGGRHVQPLTLRSSHATANLVEPLPSFTERTCSGRSALAGGAPVRHPLHRCRRGQLHRSGLTTSSTLLDLIGDTSIFGSIASETIDALFGV